MGAVYDEFARELDAWSRKYAGQPSKEMLRLHNALAGSDLSIVPNAEHWTVWNAAEEIGPYLFSLWGGRRRVGI